MVHKRYTSKHALKTQITSSELQKISAKTPLEAYQFTIMQHFQHNFHNTINILELLCVIITYSELLTEKKILLLFQVFDFDKSKSLTKDEIIIMNKCFFRGIQTATNNNFHIPFQFETLEPHKKFFPDIFSTECIVLPEYGLFRFIKWVRNQRVLIQLLNG